MKVTMLHRCEQSRAGSIPAPFNKRQGGSVPPSTLSVNHGSPWRFLKGCWNGRQDEVANDSKTLTPSLELCCNHSQSSSTENQETRVQIPPRTQNNQACVRLVASRSGGIGVSCLVLE